MSGGSMDYLHQKVEDAEFQETNVYAKDAAISAALRTAFREHLKKVAAALRAIEWNDSGDGDDDEERLIEEVLG